MAKPMTQCFFLFQSQIQIDLPKVFKILDWVLTYATAASSNGRALGNTTFLSLALSLYGEVPKKCSKLQASTSRSDWDWMLKYVKASSNKWQDLSLLCGSLWHSPRSRLGNQAKIDSISFCSRKQVLLLVILVKLESLSSYNHSILIRPWRVCLCKIFTASHSPNAVSHSNNSYTSVPISK